MSFLIQALSRLFRPPRAPIPTPSPTPSPIPSPIPSPTPSPQHSPPFPTVQPSLPHSLRSLSPPPPHQDHPSILKRDFSGILIQPDPDVDIYQPPYSGPHTPLHPFQPPLPSATSPKNLSSLPTSAPTSPTTPTPPLPSLAFSSPPPGSPQSSTTPSSPTSPPLAPKPAPPPPVTLSAHRVAAINSLLFAHPAPQLIHFATGPLVLDFLHTPPPPPVSLFVLDDPSTQPSLAPSAYPIFPHNVSVIPVSADLHSDAWDSHLVHAGFDWHLASAWVLHLDLAHAHVPTLGAFNTFLRMVHNLTNNLSTVILVYFTPLTPRMLPSPDNPAPHTRSALVFTPEGLSTFVKRRGFRVLRDDVVAESAGEVRVAALAHASPGVMTLSLAVMQRAVESGRAVAASRSTTNTPDTSHPVKPHVEQPSEPRTEPRTATPRQTEVQFKLSTQSLPPFAGDRADRVIIIGSAEETGCWKPTRAFRIGDGDWHGSKWLKGVLSLKQDVKKFEYKFALADGHGHVVEWEQGDNRVWKEGQRSVETDWRR